MFSFQTLTHSSHLVQVRIFTAVGFTYEVLMMSPTSFWTGAVTLDQLHRLLEPEDTNANVLSGAELRTNNWRAPRFCFCETYTQKEQSGCANSWSYINLASRSETSGDLDYSRAMIFDCWRHSVNGFSTRPNKPTNRNYKNRLDVDCFNPTWLHRVHQIAHQEDWWCRSVKRSAWAGGR